jgi:hypothetical protein
VNADGSVNVMLVVVVHPLASVTVHVYVPAAKLLAVAAFPPLGCQLYKYPDVPPAGVAVAVPFVPPKQEILVPTDVAERTVGCVIVKL